MGMNIASATLVVIFLHFSQNAESAGQGFKLHLAKAYSCDNSNTTYIIKDIKIDTHDDQSHLTVVVDLLQDINVSNMTVMIEKCDPSGEKCESMGKFTIKDLCNVIFAKSKVWTAVIDSIQPRPECPILKKNEYVLQNATVNVNDVMKLYPDSTKFYWKIQGILNDVENKPRACAEFEATSKT